jgi:hypothetical protein
MLTIRRLPWLVGSEIKDWRIWLLRSVAFAPLPLGLGLGIDSVLIPPLQLIAYVMQDAVMEEA